MCLCCPGQNKGQGKYTWEVRNLDGTVRWRKVTTPAGAVFNSDGVPNLYYYHATYPGGVLLQFDTGRAVYYEYRPGQSPAYMITSRDLVDGTLVAQLEMDPSRDTYLGRCGPDRVAVIHKLAVQYYGQDHEVVRLYDGDLELVWESAPQSTQGIHGAIVNYYGSHLLTFSSTSNTGYPDPFYNNPWKVDYILHDGDGSEIFSGYFQSTFTPLFGGEPYDAPLTVSPVRFSRNGLFVIGPQSFNRVDYAPVYSLATGRFAGRTALSYTAGIYTQGRATWSNFTGQHYVVTETGGPNYNKQYVVKAQGTESGIGGETGGEWRVHVPRNNRPVFCPTEDRWFLVDDTNVNLYIGEELQWSEPTEKGIENVLHLGSWAANDTILVGMTNGLQATTRMLVARSLDEVDPGGDPGTGLGSIEFEGAIDEYELLSQNTTVYLSDISDDSILLAGAVSNRN